MQPSSHLLDRLEVRGFRVGPPQPFHRASLVDGQGDAHLFVSPNDALSVQPVLPCHFFRTERRAHQVWRIGWRQ